MNLLWLIAIIPGYLLSAGYARAVILSHGENDTDAIPMGVFWPAVVIAIAVVHVFLAGSRLHAPERRRRRDAAIARDEGTLRCLDPAANYGSAARMTICPTGEHPDGDHGW